VVVLNIYSDVKYILCASIFDVRVRPELCTPTRPFNWGGAANQGLVHSQQQSRSNWNFIYCCWHTVHTYRSALLSFPLPLPNADALKQLQIQAILLRHKDTSNVNAKVLGKSHVSILIHHTAGRFVISRTLILQPE